MPIQLTISGVRLEVEAPVGRGSTSVVWRCRRTQQGDRCALKVARRAGDQAILVEEAERLLWGMSPSLPRLLGVGRIPGSALGSEVIEDAPCLLLEWMDGVTLRSFAAKGNTVDAPTLLWIARDLANALADLHAAGIAHGDIKPDNVMILRTESAPRAVLLDMGLSAAADEVWLKGATRRYLAPEALSTDSGSDARTRDLWALGALLAELVGIQSVDEAPERLVQRLRDAGRIGEIVGPLLAACPGARPPASWVSKQTEIELGHTTKPSEAIAFRQARVQRAYLNVRRSELCAAARSREVTWNVGETARVWLERTLASLVALDVMRGIKRNDDSVAIADLGPSSRRRFVVDLVGQVAAHWPLEASSGDAELLDRILEATARIDPQALTPAVIAGDSRVADTSEKSPLELALLLSHGPPRRDVLEAAESYCLHKETPLAFRLALGQRLRLVGEYGRALAVLDRDPAPLAQAEAAETARRAGDLDGALRRLSALEPLTDVAVRARGAATMARVLLDRGSASEALTQLSGVADSAAVLEVRALAQIRLQQHESAMATLEQARAVAASDEEQARILSLVGILQHAISDPQAAVIAFRGAVEYAVRAGALLEEATYLTGLAAAAVDSCRLDEAIGAAERATALFELLGQPSRAARAALNRVAAFAAAGAALPASAAAQIGLQLARAARDDRCAAYIHLALVDATDRDPNALEHAQRASALLLERSSDEELMVQARCHDCGLSVDIVALDNLARQNDAGVVARLDWWGARARRALGEHELRGAEMIVGELVRLVDSRVSAAARGRAFSAGARLASLSQLGDAARRLHSTAVDDLQAVVLGCSAELRAALTTRDWVKSLRAPSATLLLPEQIADIESLVRALGRWEKLRPLLVQILDALVLWTGVERGLLLLCAPGGRLKPRVGRNIGRADLVGHQLELSHTLAARALAQGEPIVAVDASGELESIHESVHALKLRSVLAVPLLARGQALGVVYLDDRIRRGAFGERELAWVRLVAAVAAVAIADARDRLRLRRAAHRAERAEARTAELLSVREAELGQARVELALRKDAAPTRYRYEGIIGNSLAMQQMLRLVDRVIPADVPVLVFGASGTGKELVARAIHKNGPRAQATFIAENCGAIPEQLLESALFGHVKGAFTGAARARAGLFEVADHGTLFLDEIAEMSLGMQTKLLRVLEDGEFWQVGAERSKRVDVRIIAATHRDLGAMVAAGTFRQDLFYRLNVVSLQIPPLKERHGDIPHLVQHFIGRYAAGRRVSIDKEAVELLGRYPWPGNVRQLENEIRRALVLADDHITPMHLSEELCRVAADTRPQPEGLDLRAHIDALERDLVTRALERTHGNQTRAAELLGLSRFGLQKMLRRLEIQNTGSGPPSRPAGSRPGDNSPVF